MRICGPVEELELQSPGLAAEDLAIATELLPGDGGVIRRFRELYVLAGTHVGIRIAAALREVGMREGHADNTLGAGDQLQIALVPHIDRSQIVPEAQRRALCEKGIRM